MKIIDRYLNAITMYRLTLYYLIFLVVISSLAGFFGILPYNGSDILLSSFIAIITCWVANYVFAKIFGATTNIESVFITALILVVIFPVKFPINFLPLIVLSLLAMGSKYLLTIEKRHVFNPAAIAVLMLSLLSPQHSATWWIGTPIMFVPVLLGGLLLSRKVRREGLIVSFLLTFLALSAVASIMHTGTFTSIITMWQRGFGSSAVLFFSFVMLTEPLTSPSTKKLQRIYGVIVGILYTTPLLRVSALVFTPEMALIAGNIFSYIVSPKYRLILPLLRKVKISPDTFVFVFDKVKKFDFSPGQYLEWTLPHPHSDSRGNRRYFSIVSAPHENLMIAVKFYEPSSSYKKALLALENGAEVIATSLSGDFVMPKDFVSPLVFIAGGVGIAPFRSMLEDIVERKKQVNVILVFANKRKEDIVFQDTFEKAKEFGVRTVFVLTDSEAVPPDWTGHVGHIDDKIIRQQIPDYSKRLFYISGPQLMVQNFEKILLGMGVNNKNLKLDYFPGYIETSA